MCVCPHIQKFDLYDRIYLKVGTRIDTQVHEIFGPPPRGPQRAPGGAKDLPKTSSGHKFYIFKLPINRKAAITRIYIYIYICISCGVNQLLF